MIKDAEFEKLAEIPVNITQQFEFDVSDKIIKLINRNITLTTDQLRLISTYREKGLTQSQIAKIMSREFYTPAIKRKIAESQNELRVYVNKSKKTYLDEIKKSSKQVAKDTKTLGVDDNKKTYEKAGMILKTNAEIETLKLDLENNLIKETAEYIKSLGFVDVSGSKDIMIFYQNQLDAGVQNVVSGRMTKEQAVESCVKNLANSGLKTIDYASGISRQLDTATRQNIQYGGKETTRLITDSNAKNMGTTIFEFDAHSNARPSHRSWQGKRFDTTGKDYPTKDRLTNGHDGDYGCLHRYYPIPNKEVDYAVSSDMIKQMDTNPFNFNGKKYDGYQAKEQQRLMERQIRAKKREINLLKANGQNTVIQNARLKELDTKYKSFCEAAQTYPKTTRLQTYELN